MRKSWLTAASVLAAATVEGHQAQAQLFTTNPSTPGTAPFGDVRIGTTSSPQSLTVTNAAKLGSGTIDAATAPFSGGGVGLNLGNNKITTTSFVFSPTSHGAATPDAIGINASNPNGMTTQSNTLTLTGTGVWPIYSSSPGVGTIDIGTVMPGESVVEELLISNTSSDPGAATLTGLTLLTADLTPTGIGFSLGNSLPGTPLNEGNTFDLKIDFSSLTLGPETADLTITTDQGAPSGLGGSGGQSFDYKLKVDVVAAAVPEPASIGLLASGLAGAAAVGLRRRRRPR